MPDKDGSEDKKSTKSVVNKKQKQFMNQEEQLDLSSVAEAFGGQIVGELVELDEASSKLFTTGARVFKYFKKPSARKTFMQFLDLLPPAAKRQFNKLRPNIIKLNKTFKASKSFDTIGDVKKGNVTSFKPDTPIKKPFKPLKPLKDFIQTGTEKAKTQFQKIRDAIKTKKTKSSFKDTLNKNQNKNKNKPNLKKAGELTFAGGVGTAIGTQLNKKGAGGRFRLGGLPGTAHNVGRRSNPQ